MGVPGLSEAESWGGEASPPEAACLVVVGVLSFTTAVNVAVQQGIRTLPFWLLEGPAAPAEQAGRRRPPPSLSGPSAHRPVRRAPGAGVPKRSGHRRCSTAAGAVVAACLRNIPAIGSWLTTRGYGTSRHPLTVIAAGERCRTAACAPRWRTC